MKTKYKVIGAIAIVALFACASLTPVLTNNSDANDEVYNKAVNAYINSIQYDPNTCIMSMDGVTIQQPYTYNGDSSQTTTTKYEKQGVTNNGSEVLQNLGSQSSKVYPGSILRADEDLANGTPNMISGLNRTNMVLQSSLYGVGTRNVSPTNYNDVKTAIGSMINEWESFHVPASVNFTEVSEVGHSSKQLAIDLGVDLNFTVGIGIGLNWSETDDEQTVVFKYTATYYSVNTNVFLHPGSYFASDVTAADVKASFRDQPTVLVRSATYGSMVMFSATSTSTTSDLKLALSLAISGQSGQITPEMKETLDQTSITMTVIGGSQSQDPITYSGQTDLTEFVNTLNQYIATKQVGANDYRNAALLSAETVFLDSGDNAHSFVSTEYVKKTTIVTKALDLHYLMTGGYTGTLYVQYETYDRIDDYGNYINQRTEKQGWDHANANTDGHLPIDARHIGPMKITAGVKGGTYIFNGSDIQVPLESIYLYMKGTAGDPKYQLYLDDTWVKGNF